MATDDCDRAIERLSGMLPGYVLKPSLSRKEVIAIVPYVGMEWLDVEEVLQAEDLKAYVREHFGEGSC